MLFSRKNLFTLVLLFFVYSWFFLSQNLPQAHTPPVTLAKNNVSLFIEPEDGKNPITNAIDNAYSEILIASYLFSDKEILESIKKAKARGIKIAIIMEQNPFGGSNVNNQTKKELDSYGIANKWGSDKFALTHAKVIIIDSKKLFILNQNLTSAAFSKNREYNISDTNPIDVSQVRNIFISDWEEKSFNLKTSNIIISPETSRKSISSLIKKAQKSIDIEIEVIEDPQIINLLSEKSKSVKIRIIAPSLSQIESNKNALDKLKQNGALVRTLTNPYIHAKIIIVDNIYAYTGSVNLTTQSIDKNREIGILLSETSILKKISSTFEKDWKYANNFLY